MLLVLFHSGCACINSCFYGDRLAVEMRSGSFATILVFILATLAIGSIFCQIHMLLCLFFIKKIVVQHLSQMMFSKISTKPIR